MAKLILTRESTVDIRKSNFATALDDTLTNPSVTFSNGTCVWVDSKHNTDSEALLTRRQGADLSE